jgi:hypothetical protein
LLGAIFGHFGRVQMRPSSFGRSWFGLCLLLLCSSSAFAQATQLDVSKCFPDALRYHSSSNVVEKYQYLFLSLIDNHNYDSIKADSGATALLPIGLFSGNFSVFQQKRQDYFESKSENINYYLAKSVDVSYMPSEWKSTVEKCIDDTLKNPGSGVTGIVYFPVDVDAYKVRMELKYYSSEPDTLAPRIRSSKITGGYIVDDKTNKKLTQLYPKCSWSWSNSSCPRMDAQSEFMVYRDNPNQKISITLNAIGKTNFNKSIGFDLDPLAKKRICKVVDDTATREFKTDRIEIHGEDWKTGKTYDSGKEEKGVFKIYASVGADDKYPGRVTDAQCVLPDSGFVWVMDPRTDPKFALTLQAVGLSGARDPDWSGNKVYCVVMTNTGYPPNARWVVMEGHYTPAKMSCEDQDWPANPPPQQLAEKQK